MTLPAPTPPLPHPSRTQRPEGRLIAPVRPRGSRPKKEPLLKRLPWRWLGGVGSGIAFVALVQAATPTLTEPATWVALHCKGEAASQPRCLRGQRSDSRRTVAPDQVIGAPRMRRRRAEPSPYFTARPAPSPKGSASAARP